MEYLVAVPKIPKLAMARKWSVGRLFDRCEGGSSHRVDSTGEDLTGARGVGKKGCSAHSISDIAQATKIDVWVSPT